MPISRAFTGTRDTSEPANNTSPASACSKPDNTRNAVVLPQPDGPSSETNSPGRMSRSIPRNTWWEPKLLVIWRSSTRVPLGSSDRCWNAVMIVSFQPRADRSDRLGSASRWPMRATLG